MKKGWFLAVLFIGCGFLSAANSGLSLDPVSPEWRQEMTDEFNANAQFMKSIIIEGEDPSQQLDFVRCFDEQDIWFDSTLRGTQSVNDKNYRQIIQKQDQLKAVTDAQKKGEELLFEATKKLGLNDHENKKLRLLLLYDIHAFAQKSNYKTELSDQVINKIVVGVIAKLPRAEGISPAKEKPQGLVQVQKGPTPEEIKKYRQLHEVHERELLEQQLIIKQLDDEIARIGGQGIELKALKKDYGNRIEEKEKQSLDLILQLRDVQQKLDLCDKKMKEKDLLKKELSEKIKLVEELAERYIHGYRMFFEKMKTGNNA